MIELVRRAQLLALWIVVALGVIVGEVWQVEAPRSPAPRARGLEVRTVQRVGGRIFALRLQVVIA